MRPVNLNTGSVRLLDRRTRVVELLGPEPPGSRRATDRQLFWQSLSSQVAYLAGPQPVGYCFQADGRRARFLIDEGPGGDALLDALARYPEAPARPARPYGPRGWLVEGIGHRSRGELRAREAGHDRDVPDVDEHLDPTEVLIHPGGRVLRVGGRPVRR
jgi:hypothetical protein